MSVLAYHPDDEKLELIHIDEWVVKHGIGVNGCCRICHQNVFVKAAISQKQTHFAHYKQSDCPSLANNRKPYEALATQPRDKELSAAAKSWLAENILEVYEKIRREFKDLGLLWNEFFELIETANKIDIWSLKDMPHEYIPYVLLMCTDKFNKTEYRKKSCYFVLEPSPNDGGYWNSSGKYKKLIWEVSLPSREVTHKEIKKDLGEPWYVTRAKKLLK